MTDWTEEQESEYQEIKRQIAELTQGFSDSPVPLSPGGDFPDYSQQIQDMEAPFKAGQSILGDNIAGDLLGSAFDSVRDIYRNPPSAKSVGAFGTRAVGAVGGALGTAALTKNPFAIPAGMTAGEEVANQFNQLVGLEEDRSVVADAINMVGRGALNYAMPGQGSVWRIPASSAAKKQAASEIAHNGTFLASELGYTKSKVPAEIVQAQRLTEAVPTIERSGLFQGQSTALDPATGTFMPAADEASKQTLFSMSQGIPDARAAVGDMIRTAGNNIDEMARANRKPISISFDEIPINDIQATAARLKASPEFQGLGEEIDNLLIDYRNQFQNLAAEGASKGAPGAISEKTIGELTAIKAQRDQLASKRAALYDSARKADTNFEGEARDAFLAEAKALDSQVSQLDAQISQVNRKAGEERLATASTGNIKGISIQRAQDIIQNLNLMERQAGAFDTNVLASAFRGNVKTPEQAKLLAGQLGELRRRLTDIVNSKAESALGSMPRTEATKAYSTDQLSYLNSLYGSLKTLEPALQRQVTVGQRALGPVEDSSLIDTISKAGSVPHTATGGIIGGVKKLLGMLGPTEEMKYLQRNAEIMSSIQQNLLLRQQPLIPRQTQGVISNLEASRTVAYILRNQGLLDYSQNDAMLPPEQVLQKRPPAIQSQLIQQAAQIAPEAFDPGANGYQSVFDGNFTDPFEKDLHLKSVIDSDLPVEQEAEILMPLMSKNKYVPIPSDSQRSQPMPTPTPKADIDQFINDLDIPMFESSPGLFETDPVQQLENMTKSRSRINFERSGL